MCRGLKLCHYQMINAIFHLYPILMFSLFVVTAGQRSTTPIHKTAWFIALLVLIALLLLVLIIFVLYTRHRGAKYPGKSISNDIRLATCLVETLNWLYRKAIAATAGHFSDSDLNLLSCKGRFLTDFFLRVKFLERKTLVVKYYHYLHVKGAIEMTNQPFLTSRTA